MGNDIVLNGYSTNLSAQIKRAIGYRIFFCFLLAIIILLVITAGDIISSSHQLQKNLENQCGVLESFAISQALIQNENSIQLRLDDLNLKSNSSHFVWKSQHVGMLKKKLYWRFPFSWKYIYPVKSVDGTPLGGFVVTGSFLHDQSLVFGLLSKMSILLVLFSIILIVLYPLSNKIPQKLFISPINDLLSLLENEKSQSVSCQALYVPEEIFEIRNKIIVLLQDVEQKSRQAAIGQITAQVAHDIRSPLAILDILITSLQAKVPEKERDMMRTAIRRINNIANDLVSKYKEREGSQEIFIYSALKDIVSEKDLECSEKNIKFELDFNNPKIAFLLSRGNYTEIKRMFSNLINNAVNAMPKGGKIQVSCLQRSSSMLIQIVDQGCGLSKNRIQALLADSAPQSAKIGLGLRHAKDYVKQHEGVMTMVSEEGVGTTVELSFLVIPKPTWLCESVKIHKTEELIIVDDDESIHDAWAKKLEGLFIERKDFYTPEACRHWLKSAALKPRVILSDYEFINISENGLELLSSLNYSNLKKYLVTSHVDDSKIISACNTAHFELLPKHLLPYVQISVV